MSESPREVKVSLATMAVLLHNVFIACKDSRIGFMDADKTMEGLLQGMQRDVWVKTDILESALTYSNFLDEDDNFWHPMATGFDTFLKRGIPQDVHYDKYYNILTIKDGK